MVKSLMRPARVTKHWETFEQVVASIQQLFSPDADVKHNEKISDAGGRKRQFDVVIRGNLWGQAALGVMECRDKGRPVEIGQVDGFISKAQSVNANFKAMVSRAGFTTDAIALAKENNIGTLSLLPTEESTVGFRIGFQSYAQIFEWSKIEVEVFSKAKVRRAEPLDIPALMYRGHRVVEWFYKELATQHHTMKEPGWLHVLLTFDRSRMFNVNGKVRLIAGIRFSAFRGIQKKTKFLTVSGQAFYNWQDKKWHLPNGGFITTSVIRSDLSDWDDFEGDIPVSDNIPRFLNLSIYKPFLYKNIEVIDLKNL